MSLETFDPKPLEGGAEAPVDILVVDDNLEHLVEIDRALRSPDVRIVEAHSGNDALLRLLEERKFALLIIDMNMPDLDGIELASLIRNRPRTHDIPILFLSSKAISRETMLEGHELGAVDFLNYPLVPDILRAKVSVFAELSRARTRLEAQSRAMLERERRGSEVELLELRLATERRYRSLADAIPHIVFRAGPDGTFEYLNRRWFEYTGLSLADSAKGWLSALHPHDAALCERYFDEAIQSGEPFEAEFRIRRGSDGAYLWHLFRVVPERGPTGEIAAWIGTFTDIDEARRARESLREFYATLDSVDDAVLIFEPESMQLLYANQGARRLFGASEAELLRYRPDELIRAGDAEELKRALSALVKKDRGSKTLQVRCRRVSGGAAPAEWLLQYIPYERGREGEGRAIVVARDTSERQRAEAERELLYRNALEAVRARDEFISIASHELKSPLTALSLQLEALARPRKSPTEMPGAMARKLQFAFRQVGRLTDLLNELLDLSRIQAGKLALELEELDLSELVRDVANRFAESAENVGSELVVVAKEACVGSWDKIRIEQVVVNLLSNALKFGGGKPIHLEVVRDEGAGSARLLVRDQGIGIAPEEVERIFSRFERAVPSRSYAGLGLGLYIVRQIVTAHGGTIGVESEPGEGATFIVELPLAQAGAADTEGEAGEGPA